LYKSFWGFGTEDIDRKLYLVYNMLNLEEVDMLINLDKKIVDYFKNSTKLVVSVNKISEYFNLSLIDKLNIDMQFKQDETVSIEIDEMELDNDLLTKKQIFVLMSIYAMGVGE
jgi:hypothetical protein